MSIDPLDYAKEGYETEVAQRVLLEEGLNYVLEYQLQEVVDAVRRKEAEDWLERSRNWLELVNLVARHDGDQRRSAIRKRAYGQNTNETPAPAVQLFNLASDISKLLESLAEREGGVKSETAFGGPQTSRYGYRPGPTTPTLALYAQSCTFSDDLAWVSDLVAVTRAFREMLFLIGDSQRKCSLHWELSEHIKIIDRSLREGARPLLVYRGIEAKQHRFGREPDVESTPLTSLLAEWICDYLENYSDRVDLGVCVECGRTFSRRRTDNAYCSKTCQNRVAYKRRKIFEEGLLRKIEATPESGSQAVSPGVWAYHPRLGFGVVDTITTKQLMLSSIDVIFPQITRTFHASEIFQGGHEAAKVEFYVESNPASLAGFM